MRHHPTGGLLGVNKEKRDLILVKIRLYTPAITIVVSACTGSGSSALPSPAGFAADPAPSPSAAPRVTGPAVLVFLFLLRALKRVSEPVARYCLILLVPLLLGQGLPRHDPQSR
jgi:hypothetical protein